ncbi:carbonic anhydrase [Dendrothele bispora CBS 962.96]|uniref:Carbonic anhydrase n=1 Tax=Dendrothele bispora (strain CBS 962.96) TaxID=1314807 RepID=A0A4S8MCQ6_DENBC|nr:carbonic anhydrase [Dendrothele bispora CBS 962.96]
MVSANCIYGTHLHRRAEQGVPISSFGYSGSLGPSNWASLNPNNSACALGKNQSPIVLPQLITTDSGSATNNNNDTSSNSSIISILSKPPQIKFFSTSTSTSGEGEGEGEGGDSEEGLLLENLGTTIQVVVNGTMILVERDGNGNGNGNETEFQLRQFHFHTPSEHRIGDEFFVMEMHLVHERVSDGTIAVIAIKFELTIDGSTTSLLTTIVQNLSSISTPGTSTRITRALDFSQLVTAIQDPDTPIYQYTGSLTTPPCTEGVRFLVVSKPMPLNVATFNAMKRVIKFNSRYAHNIPGEPKLLQLASAGDGL